MYHKSRKFIFPIIILLFLATGLPACSSQGSDVEIVLAPLSEMPDEVKQAPVSVQESYRFAVANPDILTKIPCYCGCGSVGHKSNYECYVAEVLADGTIVYDPHAFG